MRSIFLLAGALAIGGCGDQDGGAQEDQLPGAQAEAGGTARGEQSATGGDSEGVSMAEAAERAQGIVQPEPGRYRASVEIVNVSMPGAPPEAREQFRKMQQAGAQSREYCLTPEQASRGFAEMVRQANSNDSCTFSRFDVDGGEIDAAMTCERPGQGTGRMTMKGVGTRTSSDMTMTMNVQPPNGQAITMEMRSWQERIGDC